MVLDISNPDTVDAKKEFGLDEIITKLTDGLFGILFVTNKHTDHNLFAHFLEIFIDHMQDLAFPLSFVLAPWAPSFAWFQTGLNWFSPERLIGKNQVLFFILLSLIGGTLFNALWVGYSFSQNNFRFIWTLKILRITLGLFATILFIPILAFFVENVGECSVGGEEVSCFNGDNIFKSVITLVFTFFFIFLALAVKATFFDSDPKTSDLTGRPHSRLDILYTAFRGILTVLSIVLPAWVHNAGSSTLGHASVATSTTSAGDTTVTGSFGNGYDTQVWIMTAACVLLSGILAIGHIWYIPYYNYRYSMLRAGMNVNFFWASVCLFYTALRPNSDIGIIYLVSCPMTFVLAYYFVQFRRYMIERTPLSAINDPFTLELKIRFKLIEANLLFKEHGKPNATVAQYGRSTGDIASPTAGTSIAIRDSEVRLAEQAKAAELALLDEINDMYLHAAKILPKSCMLHLFTASFQLIYLGNRTQCLAVTAKALLMNPQLDEAFMIFRRQRLLNDKFGGGDVIDFIAYEQNLKFAKLNERKATIAGVQFWSELMKRSPSFHKLQSHGAAISTAISLAQIHFTTLLKLSPDSPTVYRMYGRFLINALNDKKSGQDLLDHADEIEEEAERENGAEDDDDGNSDEGNCSDFGGSGMSLSDEPLSLKKEKAVNINLFSEDNCVITISGERHNIGQILSMNAKANKLFGYKKGETIGRNITVIIPSPFAEGHDAYLHKYLDSGFAKIIDRSRQVLGLHKNGHLIPMILCVKHAVDAMGKQSFIGVIKPAKENATSGFIIFNADDLKIKYTTNNIEIAFKFQASLVVGGLFMGDVFSGLDSTTIGKVSSGGFQTEVRVDNLTFSVKILGEKIIVQGNGLYIVRAVFKPIITKSTSVTNLQPLLQARTSELGTHLGDVNEGSAEELDPNAMPMVFSAHNSRDNLTNKSVIARSDDGGMQVCANSKSGEFCVGENRSLTKKFTLRKIAKMSDNGSKKSDQRSESSYSKASSSRNVKRIISEKNNTSNKHLMYIHLAYIICMVVLSADAIYEDLAFASVYTTITSKIDNLNARLQSALYVAQISDSARSLDLHRINWVSNNRMTCVESVVEAQSHIINNTQYITSMISQFLDVQGSTYFIEDHALSIHETLNFEAINVFLTAAKHVAQANVNDSSIPQDVMFLLNNGPTIILDIMNTSAVIQRDDYMSYTSFEPRLFLSTAVLTPVFVLLIIFGVIFPVFYHIEKYRTRFLTMFCDIPKDVVKGIHDTHLKRLVDAQEEDEENDERQNHGARIAIET
ncbi:UNVERIFIED_CONTAM: hypothetical protein HDU68_011747 [Siphonaria sp. JEL0065]|nr:hypothetical protein HDU68_011747 [Siphonaria sp. JEL0065]